MNPAGGAVPRRLWLLGPIGDTALLAWPWLPLAIWLHASAGDGLRVATGGTFALALTLVFALEFTHRQYTYYVAYGDSETFRLHARRLVVAPLLVGVLAVLFYALDAPRTVANAAITVLAAWNVWHVVMQRFGLLRIYAAKGGAGLESVDSRRRDQILIWSLVGAETCLTFVLHRAAAAADPHGERLLRIVDPVLGSAPHLYAGLAGALALGVVLYWIRGELAAPLPWRDRIPRWSFLLSTVALLGVFVVSGPWIGFLCVTLSHAVEYLTFVHHFERRRFAAPNRQGGFLAPLMRHPVLLAPLALGLHLAAYWIWVAPHRAVEGVLVYLAVTNVLHFLYDGWIWKVRRPAVYAPLARAS